MYRYICFDAENFEFFGTDDETAARLFALDHFAVDALTGKVLDEDRMGTDADIAPLSVRIG